MAARERRRFRTAQRPRLLVQAALALALLIAAAFLSSARLQLWHAAGLHRSTRSSGAAAGDLDAALEARIPRYWAEIERICPNMTHRPYQAFDAAQRTSLAHSQLEPLPAFRGLGRWHVLRLRTATAAGALKAQGGDTLWAVLHDPATQRRLPMRPLDEGDGTYSLAFVALAPGNYTLVLRLFYTLCAGFQDPFPDFERILEHGNTTAHCYEGQKRVFEAPVIAIPEAAQFSPIPDASGGSGEDPVLGLAGSSDSSSGGSSRAGGGSARGDNGSGSTIGTAASAGAAGETGSGGESASTTASLAAPLLAPVLRADHYVFRNGPLATPNVLLGLQLHPQGMLRKPWRFAAGPERARLILWGDSTIKRTFQNWVALARYPCVWPNSGWAHRLHLELWRPPECQQVPSGQADPPLEDAFKGCTAGAQLSTVPVGCTYVPPENEMPFPDQVALFNMNDWKYNDTFARQQGAWPVPKQFSIVYSDGWGLKDVDDLLRDIRTWTDNDTVIFNIGAHAVRLLPYNEWKHYVDQVAAALASCPATVVWRGTMPIAEHAYRRRDGSAYFSAGHFQNDARRALFDSYAEFKLRSAGVRFWDIAAFALAGANRPQDMFHLDGHSMRDLNLDMTRQIAC